MGEAHLVEPGADVSAAPPLHVRHRPASVHKLHSIGLAGLAPRLQAALSASKASPTSVDRKGDPSPLSEPVLRVPIQTQGDTRKAPTRFRLL